EDFARRQHHLENGNVIRIDDTLVLLTDTQRDAVSEITRKRHIPASSAREFTQAPGDYFESEEIDVEISFGVRVAGIGAIVPVTFSETDRSVVDWLPTVEHLTSPQALCDAMVTQAQV